MGENKFIRMSDIPERILPAPVLNKNKMIRMGDLPDVGQMKVKKILYATNRKIGDVLSSDRWKGERCFIVAGGESVNDFDLKLLEGEHTIAVNLAFRLFTPEIIYATDSRLWGWIEQNLAGPDDKETFDNCPALKVWSDLNNAPLPEDILIAPATSNGRLSESPKEGVTCGTSSGFGALNLAMTLGAKEIYLIGFDFYGGRWHSGYPQPSETGNDYHLQCFEENADQFRGWMMKTGAKIINLNRKSRLKVFDFGDMPKDTKKAREAKEAAKLPVVERVKGENEPLFINFFTPERGYEKYASNLKKSLDRLDIDYSVQAIKSKGDWDANTKFKPEFILKMMDRNPNRDIVWIDADAIVVQVPEVLLKCEADFACRIRETGELISSVMFFKNNVKSRALLKEAIALIKKGEVRDFGEQKFIQEAYEYVSKRKGFTFENLPESYCWIVGISDVKVEPVIEMHQASRSLK